MLWREAKKNEDILAGFPLLCWYLSFISAFVVLFCFVCLFFKTTSEKSRCFSLHFQVTE